MFNEHPTIDATTFEKGAISSFWERTDGMIPNAGPAPNDVSELIAVFCRLRFHFRNTPDVHVAFDINECEAWLGVSCSRYGIGLFYRIDADGSRHVWSSVNGQHTDVAGYESQMRRIRSVFGEPWKITEHEYISSRHIIHRLLDGPAITECISTVPERATSDVA